MRVSEWPHRRPSGLGGGHATCCCSHSTGNLKHICVFLHQRLHNSSFVRSSSDRCQKVNLMRDYNFTLILFWPKIFFQSPSDFYVPLILAIARWPQRNWCSRLEASTSQLSNARRHCCSALWHSALWLLQRNVAASSGSTWWKLYLKVLKAKGRWMHFIIDCAFPDSASQNSRNCQLLIFWMVTKWKRCATLLRAPRIFRPLWYHQIIFFPPPPLFEDSWYL